VPTIVLAGVRDTYMGCCLIDMARRLAAAAKAGGQPLELTEYPNARAVFLNAESGVGFP
jgi:hypothetical protein